MDTEKDKSEIICYRCKVQLKERKVRLKYLGHEFFTDAPCCPICGLVYLPEEIVTGKMAEVETLLEEK